MAAVPVLKQAPLTVAGVLVHTVHPQRILTIHNLHIANTSAVAVKVRVCAVPVGQSANETTALLWDFSLPGNEFIELGEGLKMGPNAFLQAFAENDNSLILFLSGTEE